MIKKINISLILFFLSMQLWGASTPWPKTHPATAVYTQVKRFSENYDSYTWWDNSRIWMQVIPITDGPFICGPDAVIQNGTQYSSSLVTETDRSICGNLYVPQIFWLKSREVTLNPAYETKIIIGNPAKTILLPTPSEPQNKLLVIDERLSPAGRVTSSPFGIDCPPNCSAPFSFGQTVTLTAHPDDGHVLLGWSGCNGSGTCTLVMSEEKHVYPIYKKQSNSFSLSVKTDSNGLVKSNPSGVDCGESCNAIFQDKTLVELRATPKSSYKFKNWGDACSGNLEATCTVNMTENKQVTVFFESTLPQKLLSVSAVGNGTVNDSDQLIECGDKCSANYNRGTKVTLTVIPDEGWKFKNWTGACSGKRACTVKLNGNRKVKAVFIRQ